MIEQRKLHTELNNKSMRKRPIVSLLGRTGVKFVLLCTVLCGVGFYPGSLVAETIRFPYRNLSLQDVVNQAASGDTILVGPGTHHLYYDTLVVITEFLVLKSSHGPRETVLMGRGDGPVVSFQQGSKAVLEGFTVTSVVNDRNPDLKGGGIYCAPESAPTIKNNVITGNEAVFGGGVYCDTLSAPRIENNEITGNSAKVTGGGIYSARSAAVIRNNRLTNNTAANSGGAIGSMRDTARVYNNIIWKNRAEFGGGISCDRAATIIANNTVVQNSADYGGGIVVDKGSVRLTNLILWQNTKDDLYVQHIGPSARPSNSLIGDGSYRGVNGNISSDPQFEDLEQGDFQLRSGSPCIDGGSIDPFHEDVDGSVNDMGVYGGPGASLQHSQTLSDKE